MITDELLANWSHALQQDPEVRLASRNATFSSLLQLGDESVLLKARDGSLTLLGSPTTDEPWDFVVRGTADAWRQFRGPPTPTSNHPLAMAFQGSAALAGGAHNLFEMEGNYQKLFAHLPALCVILEQFRHASG